MKMLPLIALAWSLSAQEQTTQSGLTVYETRSTFDLRGMQPIYGPLASLSAIDQITVWVKSSSPKSISYSVVLCYQSDDGTTATQMLSASRYAGYAFTPISFWVIGGIHKVISVAIQENSPMVTFLK